MTSTKKNLTAMVEGTERQVGQMVGKAMCAYGNWHDTMKYTKHAAEMNDEQCVAISEKCEAAYLSEYEATIRCIGMFVEEDLYEIQAFIADKCAEEFGIR